MLEGFFPILQTPAHHSITFVKFENNILYMTREVLIKKTLDNLTKLPDQKLREVSDFAEFLLNKIDDKLITQGIQKLTTDSNSFKFLESEEELYSKADLKETYK